MDTSKLIATQPPDHEEIREDAARHPERTYRESVEAAREIAAPAYRAEIHRLMAAGALDEED